VPQCTAQQGVPCFDAECRVLWACYRPSRLRGTPRERACLQVQYPRFIRVQHTAFYRCKARLVLAKVRPNRGLAVEGFLPRAQHTHAPVTPQACSHFIQAHFRAGQAARVQYDPQTSAIAGGRATCFTMQSLPDLTAAVRRAIQRTRDTSATGDDGIGPAFIRHAVSGGTAHTPEHVLAPLLGHLFRAVLRSGHVPAAWQVARLTTLFKKGDRYDPCNCRLIAVRPVVYRLLAGVVNTLMARLCQTQFGMCFRRISLLPWS
jgi:hypothetical protein